MDPINTLFDRFKSFFAEGLGVRFQSRFPYSTYADMLSDDRKLFRLLRWNERIFQNVRQGCRQVGTILDYGSGFGFSVFCMAVLGARESIGIEIEPERVELANEIRQRYFGEFDIKFICANRVSLDKPIDAALFQNVLSHIKLPIECLADVTKNMRYGARIYIEDNNSAMSVKVRSRNPRKIWMKHDPAQEKLRYEFLKQHLQNCSEGELLRFANLSSGLGLEDLTLMVELNSIDEIDQYLSGREQPNPTYLIDEKWIDERMIHPTAYKQILCDLGYEIVQYRPVYFSLPNALRAFEPLMARVPQLFGRILPAFVLTGEKRRMSIT